MDGAGSDMIDKGKNIKLKQVHTAMGSAEAEVVKSLLNSHSIPSLLQSRVVQSVHPFTMNGLGEIKIMVAENDYERAKEIIRKALEKNNRTKESSENNIINKGES